MGRGAHLRLYAMVVPALAVVASALPAAAAPTAQASACASAICEPFAFSGRGTATTTTTVRNPDGSSSSFTYTDTFTWRTVYDLPFGGRRSYKAGWNVIGVAADTARSTFSGTSVNSCTAPEGGSCSVGGGGSSCRGAFTNTKGIPLELLVYSPPKNGTWKLAAPAHQASQRTSGSCALVGRALDDSCDPLWTGPFPGQGENSPVTARFSVEPRLVLRTAKAAPPGAVPIFASKTWRCASADGRSTTTGSIRWTGTVKALDCSAAASRVARHSTSAVTHRSRPLPPLRRVERLASSPSGEPQLPKWMKPDCTVFKLQKAVERYRRGKLVYFRPAYITWKCQFKLSFSYLTKGVIPCETPVLVTVFVTGHFAGDGTPRFEANWSGPVVGTGRNLWRGVSSFSKEFGEILTRFIPVG